MRDQVIITLDKAMREMFMAWLKDENDWKLTFTYKGFPQVIFEKEEEHAKRQTSSKNVASGD